MNTVKESPYAALKGVFHEPSRMALMTALCAAEDGLSFSDLKERCALTDGNLNRHLKALVEVGAARIIKRADQSRTRTFVYITDTGRLQFVDYLRTLEDALRQTAETLASEESIERKRSVWHVPAPARPGGFFYGVTLRRKAGEGLSG